jgi:CrcB protein
MNYVLVFVGGGLGATARYWLGGLVHEKVGSIFPVGTLAVNLIGCFFIGLLMTSMEERFLVQPPLRLFLTIGILGGFTTFSSFSFETLALLREGEAILGALNVVASLVLCLFGTWLGILVGKLI